MQCGIDNPTEQRYYTTVTAEDKQDSSSFDCGLYSARLLWMQTAILCQSSKEIAT